MRDVPLEQIEAWIYNMSQADDMVIQVGDERTFDFIKKVGRKCTILYQEETNDKFKWNEAEVRNQCLSLFKTEWILYTDADELMSDKFWQMWNAVSYVPKDAYYFPHYNLWESMDVYRVDGRWYPDYNIRLFRNNKNFKWVGSEHASLWQGNRQITVFDIDIGVLPEFHIFHYHRVNPDFREKDKTHPTSLKDSEGVVELRKLNEAHPEAMKYGK
jgi:hypothetical protein